MVVVVLAVFVAARPVAGSAASCWRPPVAAPIVDRFEAPACPYCAGRRGIVYRTTPGTPVTAVAAGRVTFSGVVVGVRYLVVDVGGGRRVTFGRLWSSSLQAGDHVAAGEQVGVSGDDLYLGVRDGDVPVDPEPLLGRWHVRPRLVPVDGSAPRPAPSELRCPAARTDDGVRGAAR